MSKSVVTVRPWPGEQAVSEAVIRGILNEEGLQGYRWSNGPGDVYAAHSHGYHKVIYVVEGSITFNLPGDSQQVTLQPGDRLDLPAGVVHEAVVGPEGVACLEAHRGE